MTKRVSVTLAICILAAGIALIGLFRSPQQPPTAEPATQAAPAEIHPANTPADATPQIVNIESFAFNGATIVRPGEQITVANLDGAAHTLTANDGSFDTAILNGGETTTLTMPTTAGTYQYFCSLHPSMVSTITVQ